MKERAVMFAAIHTVAQTDAVGAACGGDADLAAQAAAGE
jgi:3-deoxy-D-manno-octulosonic acid (KDO) 8-phosphate synthase